MEHFLEHPVVHRVLQQTTAAAQSTSVGWEAYFVAFTLIIGIIIMALDLVCYRTIIYADLRAAGVELGSDNATSSNLQ